jgi:hypothetical protein
VSVQNGVAESSLFQESTFHCVIALYEPVGLIGSVTLRNKFIVLIASSLLNSSMSVPPLERINFLTV